jgi:hypothetical protein
MRWRRRRRDAAVVHRGDRRSLLLFLSSPSFCSSRPTENYGTTLARHAAHERGGSYLVTVDALATGTVALREVTGLAHEAWGHAGGGGGGGGEGRAAAQQQQQEVCGWQAAVASGCGPTRVRVWVHLLLVRGALPESSTRFEKGKNRPLTGDDAVEGRALVVEGLAGGSGALLARAEGAEVLRRLQTQEQGGEVGAWDAKANGRPPALQEAARRWQFTFGTASL